MARDLASVNATHFDDISANNSKIFRIIEFQIKYTDVKISNCIAQLKEFMSECSLNEAFSYLIDIFGDLVN
jgi:hypothetical protein